jgi:hypothetical protein
MGKKAKLYKMEDFTEDEIKEALQELLEAGIVSLVPDCDEPTYQITELGKMMTLDPSTKDLN